MPPLRCGGCGVRTRGASPFTAPISLSAQRPAAVRLLARQRACTTTRPSGFALTARLERRFTTCRGQRTAWGPVAGALRLRCRWPVSAARTFAPISFAASQVRADGSARRRARQCPASKRGSDRLRPGLLRSPPSAAAERRRLFSTALTCRAMGQTSHAGLQRGVIGLWRDQGHRHRASDSGRRMSGCRRDEHRLSGGGQWQGRAVPPGA
jgi:hypothetical protein